MGADDGFLCGPRAAHLIVRHASVLNWLGRSWRRVCVSMEAQAVAMDMMRRVVYWNLPKGPTRTALGGADSDSVYEGGLDGVASF